MLADSRTNTFLTIKIIIKRAGESAVLMIWAGKNIRVRSLQDNYSAKPCLHLKIYLVVYIGVASCDENEEMKILAKFK